MLDTVMAGLDPAIHVFTGKKTWMPGTRAGHDGLLPFFRDDVDRVFCPILSWPGLNPAIHVLRERRRGCPAQGPGCLFFAMM
jgi:hypothetical protein